MRTIAERTIIKSIIFNPKILPLIPDLRSFHFLNENYRNIFHAVKDIEARQDSIDIVSICSELISKFNNQYKELEQTIFMLKDDDNINELSFDDENQIVRYSNFLMEDYSKGWICRRLEQASESIKEGEVSDKVVSGIVENCHKFSLMQPIKETDSITDVDNSLADLTSSIPVISTGLGTKQQLKLERRQVNILAGLPSHCKTTLAIQMTLNLIQREQKVLFFSIEMPKTDLIAKMACNLANVSHTSVREKTRTDEEFHRVKEQYKILRENLQTIKIFDTIDDVNIMIKTIKNYKPDVVFVDYFQLMVSDDKNVRAEINSNLKRLKQFIKHTDTALVLLSQVGRRVEQREDQRPRDSDLSESSVIEQLAAVIIFTYYDYKVNFCQEMISHTGYRFVYGQNILLLTKSKSRYGNTFRTKLHIEPASGRIRSLTNTEWETLIEFESKVRR